MSSSSEIISVDYDFRMEGKANGVCQCYHLPLIFRQSPEGGKKNDEQTALKTGQRRGAMPREHNTRIRQDRPSCYSVP